VNWRPRPAARQVGTPTGAVPAGGAGGPVMPARRSRRARVQLNTRVRVEIGQVLQRFVDDHETTVQDSVELALTEFLAARGYPLPAEDRKTELAHGGRGD